MPPKNISISLPGIIASLHLILTVALTILYKLFEDSTQAIRNHAANRKAHPYLPPKHDDSRSPCPALNALANHGYLPRNGRFISQTQLVHALREGYGLSLPLSVFLAAGGHALLEQGGPLFLHDLARHNFIEHPASLGHCNALPEHEYAPCTCDRRAIAQLVALADARSVDGKAQFLTPHAFAQARVNKEAMETFPLDALHEEIARGECAMVLGIFGRGEDRVPVEWIKEWWLHERLPKDWVPDHQQGLWETMQMSKKIKLLMAAMRSKVARR